MSHGRGCDATPLAARSSRVYALGSGARALALCALLPILSLF